MKTFAVKITWLTFSDHGWGNGYVAIPAGHKFHGVDYNDMPDIDVHGGLTFSCVASEFNHLPDGIDPTDWIVGFDTAHVYDTMEIWPDEESILRECDRLRQQLK